MQNRGVIMPSGTAVSKGISLWLIRKSRGARWEGGSLQLKEVKHMEGRCEVLMAENEKEITAEKE